ncbi:MAG: hypothetical protein NVS9B15_24610 [Acidobacteriaceae bacterium]
MGKIFAIAMAVLTVVLIMGATLGGKQSVQTNTAEAAVQSFYGQVKGHNVDGAYSMLSKSINTAKDDFSRDVFGSDGSLKTLSQLQGVETRVLRETPSEALVRASLTWSSAIGALHESRDLRVMKEGDKWQVVYPVARPQELPPQVLPVTYLRWDIIHANGGDDWGAQNVEAPRVRITSMNAIEKDGATIILGEVVNEDTVPAFVSINATLVGDGNKDIGQEASFDKIEHTLLPKEVTPFRIDFPNIQLSSVKNVRLSPASLLVPASADPVIGVMHQKIAKNNTGHTVLTGDLVNESGQTVNIPQVLATYYDNSGKVIWISDSYVDRALRPQIAQSFETGLSDDLAGQVHSFRVVVNHYDLNAGL